MAKIISIAVFAHNEGPRLADNIKSLLAAGEGSLFEIVILANGCRDRTLNVAQDFACRFSNIRVEEIQRADKANAWNYYVHDIAAGHPYKDALIHVFVDGDVTVNRASFESFSDFLRQYPSANAVGALPTAGRDRNAWRRRMMSSGTLAGGLYALTGNFLERIRERNIRIPLGLIGEDWLVSFLAKSDLQPFSPTPPGARRIVFASNAGFSFHSLSFRRPGDYIAYLKRLWRYALRGVQFEMLMAWLLRRYPEDLPESVEEIYLLGTPPSRLKWVGFGSLLRLLAVQKVRNIRTVLLRRIPD
ncbi:MAG: glycosyltransferase family A protein [Gammaproteobacteria bacterium]